MSIISQNMLFNHTTAFYHKKHSKNHFCAFKNEDYHKDSIFYSKFIYSPTFHHKKHSKTQFCVTKSFKNDGILSPKNDDYHKNSIFSSNFLFLPTLYHKKSKFCVIKSYKNQQKNENYINLETLLPILELLCIFSSSIISFGYLTKMSFFTRFGDKLLIFQFGVLAIGLGIGIVIREKKWSKVLSFYKRGSESEKVNFVERIEKLEEELKSVVTIVRVLSRHVEKLGVRFRVTRKNFKHPIAQAAALAQKNSEATRALAAQEQILEKELSEIQKVLLAMQEQQQKQLELILTIAKAGKLFDTKQEPTQEQPHSVIETRKPTEARPNQMIKPHIKAFGLEKESNDRV